MMRSILLAAVLQLPVMAVPVVSGGITGIGDVFIPLGSGAASETVGRIVLFSPPPNINAAAANAGLTAANLNGLPGGPFRGAANLSQDFTGGVLTDGIRFTVSATPLVVTGSPTFAYFAALDDRTGPTRPCSCR